MRYPIDPEEYEKMSSDERDEYLGELEDVYSDYAEDAEIMEGLD